MSPHDDVRRALALGLTEDGLLESTRLIGALQTNGGERRPIVWHTVMTVLEGVYRHWFQDHSTSDDHPPSVDASVIPAINALLAADERSASDADLLAALDDAARAYQVSVKARRRAALELP